MRTACSVLAVVMLVFALGACGESDEEKAQNKVCDARDDINKQVGRASCRERVSDTV